MGLDGKSKKSAQVVASDDSVSMEIAIPLTPEQATALAGISGGNDISRTDELVMDIFANDELVAEGVSGGIRAGVRGGVRAGARGGVRSAPRRVGAGLPARAEGDQGRPYAAPENEEAISFQASFFLPKHLARDGDNTVRARVRHRDKPAAEFVEVKTKITISGAGDPAQIEILDRDIPLNEVILPDVDGDGVATLMEAISLGVEAALDATTRPTEEQVRAIIDQYAQKLIGEMKRQGLIVTVDSSKIDLRPPVGGLGFAEGEVTVGNLPRCEAGRTQPETDAVQTEQTAATFVLCSDEPARCQRSMLPAPRAGSLRLSKPLRQPWRQQPARLCARWTARNSTRASWGEPASQEGGFMKNPLWKRGTANSFLPPGGGGLRWGGRLFAKSILVGSGFGLGLAAVTVIAVTVGTVKTWTSGETLTSSDLNSTISSLKTALEAIPNWTKSGTIAVYSDGNVGIATTSPGFKLTVGSGTIGNVHSQHDLVVTDSAGSARIGAYMDNKGVSLMATGAGSGGVYAYDYGTGTGLPLLLNEFGGNVGIGTTNPGYPLDISSSVGTADAQLRMTDTSGSAKSIFIGGQWKSGNPTIGTNAAYGLSFATNNAVRMTLDSSGNVGFGTSSLTNPLQMASGAYVTTGGVWTNASSRQYKENLRDLTVEEALQTVGSLRPQKFNYKAEKEDCPSGMKPDATNRAAIQPSQPNLLRRSRQAAPARRGRLADPTTSCTPEQYVGFIAEDVPDLVAMKDRKGLSAMDIVAVLTKVVQAQQNEIQKLNARLHRLEGGDSKSGE